MNTRILSGGVMFASLLVLLACGERTVEPPAAAEAAAEAHSDATHTTDAPAATMPRTAAPAGATVFFVSPSDGSTVSSPLSIEFGIDGMTVVAAGVNAENSGHHHLLVDTGLPDTSMPIPADAKHIHFGDGSTSTELQLESGEHTLDRKSVV